MNLPETIHLHPTAELAERVLLPGDPGRALALAQLLLEKPLMFNHHRGLWGYTGKAADGELLTVQSTGMGGPSAAIVLHELIALGVRRGIRVGTCGALDSALELGDLVVAREAIAADGTSAALMGAASTEPVAVDTAEAEGGRASVRGTSPPPRTRTRAHESLVDRIHHALAGYERKAHRDATIVSTDLFYEPSEGRNGGWRAAGAIAVEMEASALFAVGERAGIEVACLLTVSDTFNANERHLRIDDHALVEAAEAMGRVAAAALST
ncbi:MAG: purine-nucleoside phosphorylase [Solirubrobacteraceae bacterium]